MHPETPLWWQDVDNPDMSWVIPEELNIHACCTDLQDSDALALIVDRGETPTERYTFGELGDLSRRLSGYLTEIGLTKGSRVAVMVPQSMECLVAHLAAFGAGMISVPLSIKFGPDAVGFRLADCEAEALVIDAECWSRVHEAVRNAPNIREIIIVGDPDDSATGPGLTPIARAFDADAMELPTTSSDDPAIIIYTSGTTGNPKGALHAHRVLLGHMPCVRLANELMPQPGDLYWTPADWAWIGGLFDVVFTGLALGVPILAAPGRFSAERCHQLITDHGVRNAFLPPTALKQLRAADLPGKLQLRTVCSGGEPVGDALQAWAADHLGTHINEFYGQTEMNLVVGTRRSAQIPPAGSMGRPYSGFTVEIRQPDGTPAPTGGTGEICVRADNPGAFLGYWNQPQKTAEKRVDGWIHTGDLASIDEDRFLSFAGRVDDVISSAGYRIGPGEIEECLMGHPDVAMAAVIGVPDEERGEAIVAFVVPRDTADTDTLTPELQHRVKHQLAFYQYPRRIEYVAELPMTTTGKILRRELRRTADRS